MINHNSLPHQLGQLSFYRCLFGEEHSDSLYSDGNTELFNNGYMFNSGVAHKNSQYCGSIIGKLNEEWIGGIFYNEHSVNVHNMLNVMLTYVKPKFRRAGLFVIFHKQLDILLKERALHGCFSWQSTKNTAMLAAKYSVGYEEVQNLNMVLHKRKIILD